MTKTDCYIKKLLRVKSIKKHDAIIKAALNLFLDGAYGTTSMEQIAQLAKVSKQTIYSHFGSKEGLFSAVIDKQCSKAKESSLMTLNDETYKEKTPRELIHKIVDEHYRMIIAPHSLALYRTVIAEAPRNKELAATFLETGPEQCFKSINDYIKKEHQNGRLYAPNSRQAVELLMFITKDYNHLKCLIDSQYSISEEEIVKHVNFVTDTFLKLYEA